MGAVFPNGIKSFRSHRNILDDVDAADINSIQDEVVALESIVGPLVTEVQEIATEVEDLGEELQNEIISNEKTDTLLNTKFKNLKELIHWIMEGKHLYAIEMHKTEQTIPNWTKKDLDTNRPQLVTFPKPARKNDPKGLYNGSGITLRRGGFWIIHGHVRYIPRGGADAKGTYAAALSRNGQVWAWGEQRYRLDFVDGDEDNVYLSPMIAGYFPRGTRVALRTAQTSKRAQKITHAWFAAIRLRSFE